MGVLLPVEELLVERGVGASGAQVVVRENHVEVITDGVCVLLELGELFARLKLLGKFLEELLVLLGEVNLFVAFLLVFELVSERALRHDGHAGNLCSLQKHDRSLHHL